MHKNRPRNFAGQKRTKTAKRTRESPKRAKPGAFWVLERKTEVKTGCEQMREDNTRCNIRRDLVDRVRVSIGTKKPQAMRFLQGPGTSGLAGAEGLEPSARGFGVDVGTHHRERGRAGGDQFLPQVPGGAVLVWRCGKFLGPKQAENLALGTLKICGRVNKEKENS